MTILRLLTRIRSNYENWKKTKSSFYHIRRKVGLNAERAAEVLGISVDEVQEYDSKGAPVMAERLLLLWDRKNVGVEGWDGWLFSRGVLVHKKHRWRPEMILESRKHQEEAWRLQGELSRLKTWRGLFTVWLPRSEWTIRPGAGWRWQIAICKAMHTSSAGMQGAIAQPTTLREYKSSTTAKYNQPLPVRI
jgi:hypothetical protein